MIPGSARRIPHYISARSPSGLQRLMFLNNLRDGLEHQYFDISLQGNRWYAWFYKEIKSEETTFVGRAKAVKENRVDAVITSQADLNAQTESGD